MTDRAAIDSVVRDCERYWKAAGIGRTTVTEMRAELERHLIEASLEGRSPETVVGPDTSAFAVEWAAAQGGDLPAWEEVFRKRRRRFTWGDTAILAIVAVVIGIGLATRGQGEAMENDAWRWIWVGAAVFLGFAEMVTAGFFMLPFAVGAVIAGVLAFADVAPAVQLIVFIGTSLVALVVLQRFVRHADENQPAVGSNRFIGQRAVVLETVDRAQGSGRVRMETEEWRATTDGDPIEPGTEVAVVDVRGARLVIETID